jgi:hypothetical protein
MAGEFIEFFTELMFGSGSWIGLVLIIVLLLVITGINRYGGIIAMPIAILVGVEYGQHNLGWHAVILIVEGIFTFYLGIKGAEKK